MHGAAYYFPARCGKSTQERGAHLVIGALVLLYSLLDLNLVDLDLEQGVREPPVESECVGVQHLLPRGPLLPGGTLF